MNKIQILVGNFCMKILFCYRVLLFQSVQHFYQKREGLGVPKTYGSYVSGTLIPTNVKYLRHCRCMTDKDDLKDKSVMLFSEKRKWRT
jgi:hypothetical protein